MGDPALSQQVLYVDVKILLICLERQWYADVKEMAERIIKYVVIISRDLIAT